jgi:hypothetical protein
MREYEIYGRIATCRRECRTCTSALWMRPREVECIARLTDALDDRNRCLTQSQRGCQRTHQEQRNALSQLHPLTIDRERAKGPLRHELQ